MASNRTLYHVVPNASGDKWLITPEGSDSTPRRIRKQSMLQDSELESSSRGK